MSDVTTPIVYSSMRKYTLAAVLLAAVSLAAAAASESTHRPIQNTSFGRAGEANVQIYTLTNDHGLEARIMTYGATLVSLRTPDSDGRLKSIILGFDTLDPYLAGVPYLGASVGRFANRIANGRFILD